MSRGPNVKLVMVEWVDSCSYGGIWKDPSELDGGAKTCFTVGWVIHENAKSLTLASSAGLNATDGFDQVAGDMTIPRAAITRTKVLAKKRL
jgi:hypothetical protein